MGEDGEIVVGDFFGGRPEFALGDFRANPIGAGLSGCEVAVRKGIPCGEFDVILGFSEVDVAGDGYFRAGLFVAAESEGVEGELQVLPDKTGGCALGVGTRVEWGRPPGCVSGTSWRR